MPIRKLGSLSNLAGYVTHNNRQTTARKVKKKPGGSSGPLLLPPDSLQSTWFCECEKHSGRALREAWFLVLILPKFHCEINPLEMVWGRAKFHYRLYPPSKKEEDLEANHQENVDSLIFPDGVCNMLAKLIRMIYIYISSSYDTWMRNLVNLIKFF